MQEQFRGRNTDSIDNETIDTIKASVPKATNKNDVVERNKKTEMEHTQREAAREKEMTETFGKIKDSLENKIAAAKRDIKTIHDERASQWIWERMSSNSESQIAEFQKMADNASAFLARLEDSYAKRGLSVIPEIQDAFLLELQSYTKTDENGVPLMDENGQFVSELLRNKPNFAKLQQEFESIEYKLDLAEQGLQYSQTVLEIAASYAGPPGVAAALLPKYIVQLSTGQSTPTNIALQVLEDVVSSYIGSGKVAKAVLQKLGPFSLKLLKIFEASEKSGWTKNAIKSLVVQAIEVFRDKELQNAFAWGKEQVTGEEAHYQTYSEVAAGQVIGKAIGKGFDVTGAGDAIHSVARGVDMPSDSPDVLKTNDSNQHTAQSETQSSVFNSAIAPISTDMKPFAATFVPAPVSKPQSRPISRPSKPIAPPPSKNQPLGKPRVKGEDGNIFSRAMNPILPSDQKAFADVAKQKVSTKEKLPPPPKAKPNFEKTVRRKIENAFGGDPESGEMTGEFLRQAGLTHEEIQQAKTEGILRQGDAHYVLASRRDVEEFSVRNPLPREKIDIPEISSVTDIVKKPLLERMEVETYEQMRERISNLKYTDIVGSEAEYNANVKKLDEKYHNRKNQPKTPVFATEADGYKYSQDLVDSTIQNGDIDRSYSVYDIVHYGEPLGTTQPFYTIYVNPRMSELGHTLSSLDTCLKGCNAQIKVNNEDMAFTKPEARPYNSIVVYIPVADKQSMNSFLKNLSIQLPDIGDCMKPETFHGVVSTLRIPLAPGITMVERNNGNSWDNSFRVLLGRNKWLFDKYMKLWSQSDNAPKPTDLALALGDMSNSRNLHMPGLLSDEVFTSTTNQ